MLFTSTSSFSFFNNIVFAQSFTSCSEEKSQDIG